MRGKKRPFHREAFHNNARTDAARSPPSTMSGIAQVDEDVLEGVGRPIDITPSEVPSTSSYSVNSGQAWGAQVGDSSVGLKVMELQLDSSLRAEGSLSVLAYLDSNERLHDIDAVIRLD